LAVIKIFTFFVLLVIVEVILALHGVQALVANVSVVDPLHLVVSKVVGRLLV
jgi:hypothetical protein